MSVERTRAWRTAVAHVAEQLGPPWVVTGSGLSTVLTYAPVDWWVRQVGFARKSGVIGQLFTREECLTEYQFDGYTDGTDNYYGEDKPRSGFVPEDEDAAFVLRWWCRKSVERVFAARTDGERVDVLEERFARRADATPRSWAALAGWRVILGSGDPVPVIDAHVQWIIEVFEPRHIADELVFWASFRELAVAGDRDATLRFLDEHRRAGMAAWKVPESAIADVL